MPRASAFRLCRRAAVALVAGLAGTAWAQSSVIYGLVDVSGSYTRVPGQKAQWQLDSVNTNMSRSFIGFRGSEDLGGGLRAVFRLESYVRADIGASGRNDNDVFWSRDSNVGLSGQFGTTTLGRNVTPLYLATIYFNPFGESFGFSPATRQYYASAIGAGIYGDRSWSNSISYQNNTSDAPLRVHFAAALPENHPGSQSSRRNYGLSTSYISGPFAVSIAGEHIGNSQVALPAGFDRQNALQAAATYDFKFVRVYGQAGRIKTYADNDVKTVLWQLGAAIPIDTSLILIGYGRAHASSDLFGRTDRTGSIAYDYFLSKNTDIYVAALYEKVSNQSDGKSFAGGLRMRF